MVLSRFERRLERLVEGAFSKTFRSGLQPVEIGRRLMREIEVGRTLGLRGPVAPNHFVVRLSPSDLERFATFRDALVGELGQVVREYAKDEGYAFLGPVVVEVVEEPGRKAGDLTVDAAIDPNVAGGGAALLLGDGNEVALSAEAPTLIGRLPDCAVRLSDPQVSRHHADVRLEADGWHVNDLGSTNGTLVNGVAVRSRRLAEGDEITIGGTRVRFRER